MSSLSSAETLHEPPPETNRYITTHNASGIAVFDTSLPTPPPLAAQIPGGYLHLVYTTSGIPVTTIGDADLAAYKSDIAAPRMVSPGGTAAGIISFEPGAVTSMHRTVSLDFDVVLEGEVEFELDGGEVRRLKVGDSVVVRGTMHRWRNVTPDGGWARLFGVTHELAPVEVEGKRLGEDWDG